VQLVELMYPERRNQPWLRTRGLAVTAILFLLGCRIAWYGWIKRVRPMIFHAPPYHPSPLAFAAGLLAMIVLVSAAFVLREPRVEPERSAPSPAMVFVVVLLLGLPWYGLLTFQFSPRVALQAIPFWIPMIAGVLWGALVLALMRRWSASRAWGIMHRYAAVFAAMLVCMLGGWLGASVWLRIDKIAQVVFDVSAILLMISFGRSMMRREPSIVTASGAQ
jgi:hypothetical protein